MGLYGSFYETCPKLKHVTYGICYLRSLCNTKCTIYQVLKI